LARKRKTRDRYRDTTNGRFVKRSVWEESISKRYVRERYVPIARAPKSQVSGGVGGAAEVMRVPQEEGFFESGDFIDEGYEAPEEDEY